MVCKFRNIVGMQYYKTISFTGISYQWPLIFFREDSILSLNKNRSTSIQYFSFASQGRKLCAIWVVYDNSLTSMSWITDIFILYLVEYYHFHLLVQSVFLNFLTNWDNNYYFFYERSLPLNWLLADARAMDPIKIWRIAVPASLQYIFW